MSADNPPPDLQRAFWRDWNLSHRAVDQLDDFMERQRHWAVTCAAQLGRRDARILDVGCGTGWLANELTSFGRVTGTDLSPDAIEEGRRRYPKVNLIVGDFATVALDAPFDLVVSADVIAHVPDQEVFVARVASLLRPGGIFLLMTQNPFVWHRRSSLRPQGAGQIRRWPSLARLHRLLAPAFRIRHLRSLVPGGDRGVLWWVENEPVRRTMNRLIGRHRWRALLERALLGRELVIIARRR